MSYSLNLGKYYKEEEDDENDADKTVENTFVGEDEEKMNNYENDWENE